MSNPLDYATAVQRRRPIVEALRRPPGWALNLAVLAVLLAWLHSGSVPNGYFRELFLSFLAAIALDLVWLLRVVLFLILNRGRLRAQPARAWRRWALAPALAMAALLLMGRDVPFQLRFALSRRDLARLTATLIAATPAVVPTTRPDPGSPSAGPPVYRKAGWFEVEVVSAAPGRVYLRVEDNGFFGDAGGLVWSPATPPPDPQDGFQPIGGGWYKWFEYGGH